MNIQTHNTKSGVVKVPDYQAVKKYCEFIKNKILYDKDGMTADDMTKMFYKQFFDTNVSETTQLNEDKHQV